MRLISRGRSGSDIDSTGAGGRSRFTGRQVTTMVVAICIAVAVVGAPVAVAAATGQLVNITDPVTSSYQARVSSAGALKVTGAVSSIPRLPGAVKNIRLSLSEGGSTNVYTVPTGRTFLVRTVSAFVAIDQGTQVGVFLHFSTPNDSAGHYVSLPVHFTNNYVGLDNFNAVEDVEVALPAGSQIFGHGNTYDGSGGSGLSPTGLEIDLFGYLI